MIADQNQWIVITKDEDFRASFLLRRTPRKLVRISLGNISNDTLIELFSEHLALSNALTKTNFFYLELGKVNTLYTF